MAKESGFGKIRSFLWPIYGYELRKFIPMFILFFLVSINYHLLRILKDSLIITAPNSGAEAIPFLKVWAMLPTAIIMVFLFTRFSNIFNRENIFYVIVTIFIAFFSLFIFFLYPHREALALNNLANSMQNILPYGFHGFTAMIRHWSFSLFYVMAESWSNIVVSVLLWGFANDVTKVDEAKRFYALFGIGINSAGILAGESGEFLAKGMQSATNTLNHFFSFLGKNSSDTWDQTLTIFMCLIILNGLVILGLYRLLHVSFFPTHRYQEKNAAPKPKMSLRENISYILKSKYLIYVAVIVLAYNIFINLTEVLWKSQLKELIPNPADYTAYMSRITFYTGIIATTASFFISGNIIRHLGWKFAAYITPTIFLFTGIGFFYFLFSKHFFPNYIMFMGITPLALTVFFGSLQNCLSRACKYTLFDDTKEMAFIPLSPESRIKGKSAIDGIGSRLGKSGSSLLMQILLMCFSTTSSSAPFIVVIMMMIFPVWFFAIHYLGKGFDSLTEKKEDTLKTV